MPRALGGGRRTALRALWSIDLRLMSMVCAVGIVVDTRCRNGVYAILEEGR